jgi:hypothetical protein
VTSALAVAAILLGLTGAAYCIRRARRAWHGDYRTRNDQVAAQRITRFELRPEPAAPGQDNDLLLDAQLAYHGPAELNQHREEEL